MAFFVDDEPKRGGEGIIQAKEQAADGTTRDSAWPVRTYRLAGRRISHMFKPDIPIREKVPFDLQRRIMAHLTVDSWDNIPHAGLVMDLDVTAVLTFIDRLRGHPDFEGVRVTLNSVLLKIIAECLKRSPALNAHVDYSKSADFGSVTVFDEIHIATPFLLEDGRTITTVLKDVGNKSLRDVCLGMEDLRRRVGNTNVDYVMYEAAVRDTIDRLKRLKLGVLRRIRRNFIGRTKIARPGRRALREYRKIPESDRITVDDLISATILVSNIGSVMKELRAHIALLEVIPPQVLVIGLCAARKQPLVMTDEDGNDSIEIRWTIPMSVYADHRAVDFARAVGFLKEMVALCTNPERLVGGARLPERARSEAPEPLAPVPVGALL